MEQNEHNARFIKLFIKVRDMEKTTSEEKLRQISVLREELYRRVVELAEQTEQQIDEVRGGSG